jgi:hypothetical protein
MKQSICQVAAGLEFANFQLKAPQQSGLLPINAAKTGAAVHFMRIPKGLA